MQPRCLFTLISRHACVVMSHTKRKKLITYFAQGSNRFVMILTCPNCETRYLVDPAAIGMDGRQVRCANCSHEWFEPAPEQQPLPEPPAMPDLSSFDTPADDALERRKAYKVNLPVVVDEPKLPGGLIAGFCIVLIATLLISGTIYHRSVMKYAPFTKGIYSVFGLYPTKGLMLSDVMLTKKSSIKGSAYLVDCKIINVTKNEQITPGMMISLLDKDGNVITQQKETTNEGKSIAAGSTIACDQIKVELNSRSKNAQKIRLDIGNAYDLFIRD